jgi:hypothetical protein
MIRRRQSGVFDEQNVQGRCAGEARHGRFMCGWAIFVACMLMAPRLEMVGDARILRLVGFGSLQRRMGGGCWSCEAREDESCNEVWCDAARE